MLVERGHEEVERLGAEGAAAHGHQTSAVSASIGELGQAFVAESVRIVNQDEDAVQ